MAGQPLPVQQARLMMDPVPSQPRRPLARRWIVGDWIESGARGDSIDPATGAVALANDSEYGLSAGVFSADVDRPLCVALQLQSGTVWINDWAVLHNQSEEGGFKGSGQGRMRGLAVMDDSVEYKHIAFAPGITGTPK